MTIFIDICIPNKRISFGVNEIFLTFVYKYYEETTLTDNHNAKDLMPVKKENSYYCCDFIVN